jgi:hypothetical protein
LISGEVDCSIVGDTINAHMGRKVNLVTPRQYATKHGVAYTTVMYWLQSGKIPGAEKTETPTGHYWLLPDDTPNPELKKTGRPRKNSKKQTTKKKKATKD